jgi:hypothetical protein
MEKRMHARIVTASIAAVVLLGCVVHDRIDARGYVDLMGLRFRSATRLPDRDLLFLSESPRCVAGAAAPGSHQAAREEVLLRDGIVESSISSRGSPYVRGLEVDITNLEGNRGEQALNVATLAWQPYWGRGRVVLICSAPREELSHARLRNQAEKKAWDTEKLWTMWMGRTLLALVVAFLGQVVYRRFFVR